MSMPPETGDLLAEVKALRERVATLERSDRLIAASVREPGKILFYDSDGNLILEVGRITLFGTESVGVIMQDPAGNNHFDVGDDGNGYGFGLRDLDGNGLIVPDRVGFGLSRPYLVGQFYPLDLAHERRTSDTSWKSLWSALWNVQHKGLRVDVGMSADSGTVGEWRVYDSTDATVVCAARSIPDGFFGTDFNTGDFVTGDFGDDHQLELQVRVTSGAGQVGIQPHLLRGQQS